MSVALNAFQTAYDNYARLLVLVTQQVANPTQANVDAITASYGAAAQAGTAAGVVAPQITHSIDGVSYDWIGLQNFIVGQMKALKLLIVIEGGPWVLRSKGAV